MEELCGLASSEIHSLQAKIVFYGCGFNLASSKSHSLQAKILFYDRV